MHVLLERIMLILKGNFGAELIMLIKSSAAVCWAAKIKWATTCARHLCPESLSLLICPAQQYKVHSSSIPQTCVHSFAAVV